MISNRAAVTGTVEKLKIKTTYSSTDYTDYTDYVDEERKNGETKPPQKGRRSFCHRGHRG
jgi:hypothetical protein